MSGRKDKISYQDLNSSFSGGVYSLEGRLTYSNDYVVLSLGLNSHRKKCKNAENTDEEKKHRYPLVVVTIKRIDSLVQRTLALPFYGHTLVM